MAKQKTDAEIAAAAAKESLRLIEQEAKIRERMNSGYDEYIKAVKEAKLLQETLNRTTKLQEEVEKRIAAVKNKTLVMTKEELAAEEAKLEYLKKQNEIITKQVGLYKAAAKEANVGAMALGKASASLAKSFSKFPNLIQSSFGKLKGLGIFEMDKAMKQTALSMGVLSKESLGMRSTITNVAKQTTMIGVGLAKVAKLQEDYSYNLGRNVLLSQKGLKAMAEMSVVTGLGAEGTAQMAADMDVIGLSAERTGEFVEGTMKNSSKMGLNASKVMKNLAGNFKMLNKYNFKEGAKGLASMAQTVTKLGVGMEAASSFADKLWNIEGAVEMSAQLNVMGGEWAAMADPFHLMYMARNDMEGLTKEIANAAKQSVMFNKETGEFDMSAEGMHKLKIIAEQTGLAYDDLVTMGKNAKKFEKIESQITFGVGGGKEGQQIKDYLTSKSYMNKNGDATIMLNGAPKLVKTLTESDKNLIKAQIKQEEDMEERAKQARTFDETLGYFIDNLKVSLLPMLEGVNKMIPKLDAFVAHFNDKGGWGEKLEAMAKWVGDLIGALGSWVIDNPIKSGLAVLTAKLLPGIMTVGKMLWDTAKWFMNGVMLGNGFNSVASAGGGGDMLDEIGGMRGKGGRMRNMKAGWTKAGRSGKGLMGKTFSAAKGFMGKTGMANGSSIGRTAGKMAPKATGSMMKALKPIGKLAGGLAKIAPWLNVVGVAKDKLDFFGDEKTRSTGIGGWAESFGGSGMDIFDGIGGEYNPIKWATNASGLSIKNMATDNVANARAIYRKNHPNASTSIPNSKLIKDIRMNPENYNSEIVEDAQDVQNVQDGVSMPGRGPFTITDKFGKMARTHKRDGLFASPNAGAGMGGGSMTHKFDKLDISGTIEVVFPGGESTKVNMHSESMKSKMTNWVQEGIIKRLNMGKLGPGRH
jgi:hypothetical protein